jgi:uncharacterized membrane protein
MELKISDLAKIKSFVLAMYLLVIGGSILPGYLFIFVYFRSLFSALSIARLLFLSTSISAPVLVWGCYLSWIIEHKRFKEKGDELIFLKAMIIGSVFSILSLSLAILIGYLFKTAVLGTVIALIAVQILFYSYYWFKHPPSKKD